MGHGTDPLRPRTRPDPRQPRGGDRLAPRARVRRLRDRFREWLLDGLSVGGAVRRGGQGRRCGALRARAAVRLHGHVEASGRKFSSAVGALDRSAGIAAACGAEVVVFHPGFLLGRPREAAIASVVEQLGTLRERLEGKERAVPFGVEVMGRVRDLGSLDDVIEIARRTSWVRPVLDFAHMHATSDGAYLEAEPVRRGARSGRRGARARCSLPHSLFGHRIRQSQRVASPPVRRRDTARGAVA